MKRYFNEIKAKVLFMAARFGFKKHRGLLARKVALIISWIARRRSGKQAMDFMNDQNSADEQF